MKEYQKGSLILNIQALQDPAIETEIIKKQKIILERFHKEFFPEAAMKHRYMTNQYPNKSKTKSRSTLLTPNTKGSKGSRGSTSNSGSKGSMSITRSRRVGSVTSKEMEREIENWNENDYHDQGPRQVTIEYYMK